MLLYTYNIFSKKMYKNEGLFGNFLRK